MWLVNIDRDYYCILIISPRLHMVLHAKEGLVRRLSNKYNLSKKP